MKVSFADYSKKLDVSVLVAMAVFKVLQDKYQSKKISDIAQTTSGGTPSRSNADFYNGEIAWLKSGELNDGIILKADETITELGLKNSSAKLFPKGTLLIAMYGATTGKVGILDIDASTNQAVCAIFPSDEVERDFLFWFLRQHRYEFIRISKGGAQPNISQTLINQTNIPIPPIEEQQKISQFLMGIEKERRVDENLIDKDFLREVNKFINLKSNSDNITTELSQQLELVSQLRQAFLREAMQGKLVLQDENDESAEILLAKIKAEKEKLIAEKKIKKDKSLPEITLEEIPFEIPHNWTWCRLGRLCNLITSGSRDWAKYYANDGAIFVRMGNLSKNSFNLRLNHIQYVNPPKISEGKRTRLEENDILVSITGEVGNLGLIPKGFGEAYINQHTALVRLSNNISQKYFAHLFLSKLLQEQFNSPQRGLKNSFRLSDIDFLIIPLPPLAEQKRIVEKLEKLMKYCDELENNIRESKSQAESLLQVALKEALNS